MDDIQNNTNLRNIKEQLEQRLLPAATLTMKSTPTPAMSVHRSHVPVRVLISAYMVSSRSAPVAVSADERSPLATFAQLVATSRKKGEIFDIVHVQSRSCSVDEASLAAITCYP